MKEDKGDTDELGESASSAPVDPVSASKAGEYMKAGPSVLKAFVPLATTTLATTTTTPPTTQTYNEGFFRLRYGWYIPRFPDQEWGLRLPEGARRPAVAYREQQLPGLFVPND